MTPFGIWAWAAGAALGGAGALAARYRQPRLVLAVFSPSHLEPDWTDHVGLFWALSAKLLTGTERTSQGVWDLLDQGSRAGLRRWGWGYHFCRNNAEAEAEGIAAGQAADLADVDVYGWNTEREWGGSKNFSGADNPILTSSVFADSFHSTTKRRRKLAWNAYTTESARWFGSPHVALDVPANVAMFDIWSPMIYGSGPAIIADKWGTRVRKWSKTFPGLVEFPMVGTGRYNPSIGLPRGEIVTDPKTGQPVGGYMGYASDIRGVPGLETLMAKSLPQGLQFFYGAGSRGMLTLGNEMNPSLVDLARTLKAQHPLMRGWV